MNSTIKIVVFLSHITATALASAAQMQDEIDIAKPDIQETRQQSDSGFQVRDVLDVRLSTRSFDEQRTLKDTAVKSLEQSTSKSLITPINPRFPR